MARPKGKTQPVSTPVSPEVRIQQTIADRLAILSSDGPPLTTVAGRQQKRAALLDLHLMAGHVKDKVLLQNLKTIREILRDAASDREDENIKNESPSMTIAEAVADGMRALTASSNPYGGDIWEARAKRVNAAKSIGKKDADDGDDDG